MSQIDLLSENSKAEYPRNAEARTFLLPYELSTLVKHFKSNNHRYFPADNNLKIAFRSLINTTNTTVAMFRSSYNNLCWDQEILEKAGFANGRQVLELGSGNNNLITSPAICTYLKRLHGDDYLLSNYSGGRGDYFSLEYLSKIIALRLKFTTKLSPAVSVSNLCHSVGAQGAITGLASYIASHHPGQSVLFADSTYCGMYAPFVKHGVPIKFIKTTDTSKIPNINELLEALKDPEVCGFFLIPFHNPSGQLYSYDDLELLCRELKKQDKYLISSEVYDGMNWNCQDDITAQVDRAICNSELLNFVRFFSLSKSRGLAGLRAGFVFSTEDICYHISQLNALHSYNPPMSNAKLIVLHELLNLYQRSTEAPEAILNYLGLSKSDFFSIHETSIKEKEVLNSQCRLNFLMLIKSLLGAHFSEYDMPAAGDLISNSRYDIIVPHGGMNCYVRIKYLEEYDQIDLFRKTYLWSGLIMHTSRYINNDSGIWMRITLTHSNDLVFQLVSTLLALEENYKNMRLEAKNNISVQII